MPIPVLTTFVAGTKALAAAVNANFAAIRNWSITGIGPGDLQDVALLNATKHGNLGTGKPHNAADIHVVDAGLKYTATETESALAEIATFVGMATGVTTKVGKFVGVSTHATDPTLCTVTVPADTATTDILITGTCYFLTSGGGGGARNYLYMKQGANPAVDLSAAGTVTRFILGGNASFGAGAAEICPSMFVINTTTVPAFDITKEYTFYFGATVPIGTSTNTDYTMSVFAI